MFLKRIVLLLITILSSQLFSKDNKVYTNCNFIDNKYENICLKLKNEVPVNYINYYFLQEKNKIKDLKLMKKINENMKNKVISKEEKINIIKKHVKSYKEKYNEMEFKYKINKELLASILFNETNFGKNNLEHFSYVVYNNRLKIKNTNIINKTEKDIKNIIKFCFINNIKPKLCNFKSSYKGKIGFLQLSPKELLKYPLIKKDFYSLESQIENLANYLTNIIGIQYIDLIDLINFKNLEDEDFILNDISSYDFSKKNKYKKINKILENLMKYKNISKMEAFNILSLVYHSKY